MSLRKSIAFGAGDIAESADNDVHQAYNAALTDAAKAPFEPDRDSGQWSAKF